MKYQNWYQASLIFFALLVVFATGVFVYKELFPEYKTYQYAYKKLEKLREEKPALFQVGIKQILIPDPDNGPELIDRCTSCHVAMNLPHFSPTRLALDVNDNPVIDVEGIPVQEPNPNYVFLKAPQNLQQYRGALNAHPLIGAETTPFEFHPVEEYGCTSCHSGNGRALVAKRAHGPIDDYEEAEMGPVPQFLERDEKNDPEFAGRYNGKPGHDLIFQTKPLLVGPLIEAKCMQCHQTLGGEVASAVEQVNQLAEKKSEQLNTLKKGVKDEHEALITLLNLQRLIHKRGRDQTIEFLELELGNFTLTPLEIDAYEGQLTFMKRDGDLVAETERIVGTHKSAEYLLGLAARAKDKKELKGVVSDFFEKHKTVKQERVSEEEEQLQRYEKAKENFVTAVQDKEVIAGLKTNLGGLFAHYQRGKELFVSQSCYACHRIAGISRSSVGPELTQIGLSYPWFVKESIVWPQADLSSSTMPNFQLDHEEVEDLLAFLMAQTGNRKVVSEIDHKVSLAQWEAGAKLPWEEPIAPINLHNLSFGQKVYATEGCAACHKLEGFETDVKLKDSTWFAKTFPENILGVALSMRILEEGETIDLHLTQEQRDTVLNEVEEEFPGLLIGYYPSFKFAQRAQNHALDDEEMRLYQKRLHKVLMATIGEYGLGRDIAPPLNWSGVMRSDAWLLGHFHNPAAYTARSLMPVMPFDNTKFFALNYMLKEMGKQNRIKFQEMWKKDGFNPPVAYQLLCAACHGPQRQGNGPISEWIYPVPKNLRNPVFLRNLTKARAEESITHGVVGTPMPPWGEGLLSKPEITQLVDWIYQGLPSSPREPLHEDYKKWSYSPQDVVKEMKKENDLLVPIPSEVSVGAYFEERGPEKTYIREKYYTEGNLNEIRPFYNVNCAVCHGKEGTGAGLRSALMVEAKPRMFTNLPWIQSRDDVRLLRSIKYGIAGTAMTPWGDQTTSKQRMQLTMLVRDFTRGALERERLEEVIYKVFDKRQLKLEEARISADPKENERLLVLIRINGEEREIFHTLGSLLIAKNVPMLNFYTYMEVRDPRDLDLVYRYLDARIAEYETQVNPKNPLGDTEKLAILEEQRGYINLKTKLQTETARAKKLLSDDN